MRRLIILLSISALAALVLVTGCREKVSKEVDFGTVQGSVYSNDYFGMTATLPGDWSIQDREAMKMIMNEGKKMAAGKDKNFKRSLDAAEAQSITLLAAFQHPLGTQVRFNPNLMCLAERVRNMPGIKEGKDYLEHSKKTIARSQMRVKFIGDITRDTLDDVDFDIMTSELTLGGMNINQKTYATVRKGYALMFIITFISGDQEDALLDILESVTFKEEI